MQQLAEQIEASFRATLYRQRRAAYGNMALAIVVTATLLVGWLFVVRAIRAWRLALGEAHEALEDAWNAETGEIRNLYRGILQIALVYLHITRGNYTGAVKVYGRSLKWLKDWPAVCRGIFVEELRRDAERAIDEVKRLGRERIGEFDEGLLKPVKWDEEAGKPGSVYICDRCGSEMHEKNCKVTCPNCGNRFDCSDLNLYFEEG